MQLHKILITEIKETVEITQPPTLQEHEASMFKLLSSFLVTHRPHLFYATHLRSGPQTQESVQARAARDDC